MNRELKFRVWDSVLKNWQSELKIPTGQTLENQQLNGFTIWTPNYPIHGDNRFKFQQSTGLKDKNQNDIYQGDILQYQYLDNNNFYEATGEVIWTTGIDCYNNMFAGWEVTFGQKTKYINKNCEVIGNIFENPELLDDTKISVKIEKRGRGRPKKEIF